MSGMRSNPIFRRMFGDAFPSSSNLAFDMCKRGEVSSTSHMIHLGCGVGSVSSLINSRFSCNISGVDASSNLIEIANSEYARDTLKFDCAPLHKTNFSDSVATHVFTEAILSIHRNPKQLFDEIKRCLTADGLLLNSEIVITDSTKLDARVNKFLNVALGDDSTYSLDDWECLLETNGFDVIQAQIEPSIMRSNGKKLRRALFGVNLLRKTGQISFSALGLGALENDFDAIAKATLTAIDDGIITYASFISKPNNSLF
ncbi:MAG: class I SAM-dependent methyltransferase [Candidatus Thalassarchaeaceae archaeon]|nr:class I SAM-dependent methyltransferase [Candidatus Thalassarchaeaceae archaeon]MDP7042970.1 class I SAM-dependent methyltransferase [Candidatus Thalassarchaeaceae archaeon]